MLYVGIKFASNVCFLIPLKQKSDSSIKNWKNAKEVGRDIY